MAALRHRLSQLLLNIICLWAQYSSIVKLPKQTERDPFISLDRSQTVCPIYERFKIRIVNAWMWIRFGDFFFANKNYSLYDICA